MWLLGVVIRRYIDFLILLIPTPLVSALFCSSIPTFCSLKKIVFVLVVKYRNVILKKEIYHVSMKYSTHAYDVGM